MGKRLVIIILAALFIAIFLLRVESFNKKHSLTYDETVYAVLAAQIMENPANYNTIGLYNVALSKGRKLPGYFKRPLFKHPPLFTHLISASYSMFGKTYYSAFKVSLFFGVLLIVMAYLLGSSLFDNRVGIFAALLMCIEPVTWISSQKIWMETTLAFFTVLSLCLFARSIKKYNPYLIIASGIAAGLAVITKYPGILSTGIIFLYAICVERQLFRKRAFIFSLAIPFIMLMPWLEWNYNVYGTQLFSGKDEITYFLNRMGFILENSWLALFLLIGLFIYFLTIKKRLPDFYEKVLMPKFRITGQVFGIALVCMTVFMLRTHVVNALNFAHVPAAGWLMGIFKEEPWYFYLGRLVELSPFYIFSILGLALFVVDRQRLKEYFFLILASAILLAFYILWKNFQCRYITAVAVPLIVLSSKTQIYLLNRLNSSDLKLAKSGAMIFIILMIVYAAIKTLHVDLILAVPNNICYF